MKRKYMLFYTVAAIATLLSCVRQPDSALEAALRHSGANRPRLEAVIEHYSQRAEDSLHLAAARFLIGNMPGHYAIDHAYARRYIRLNDSIYPRMSNVVKRVVYNIPVRELDFLKNYQKVEDCRTISSDFLIDYIDNAIALWKQASWLERFTFDEFCEYVLPYRIANEPLLNHDSTLHMWTDVVEAMHYYRYRPKNILEYKSVQRDVLRFSDNAYFRNLKTPTFRTSTYNFDCLDLCYYELSRLRPVGIPCAIDFVPGWPYRNGKHYWVVTLEPYYRMDMHGNSLKEQAAKVFRMTYSHHPIPVANGKDSVPLLFKRPFYKDVTRLYVKTSDLEVPVKEPAGGMPDYVYLAIFNDLKWNPVAWAQVKDGVAVFTDMGREVVYQPVAYRGYRQESVGYPFLLDVHGTVRPFIPDANHPMDLRLTRKFPFNDYKITWSERMKGCRIEASNDALFAVCDTLYTIRQPNPDLNYSTIQLAPSQAYRYWRIIHPGQTIHLGEWELYDASFNRLKGQPIPYKKDDSSAVYAFDGDVLTFTDFHSCLCVDLGQPMEVATMKIIPRTDANGIVPGHWYELLYCDADGWQSVGKAQAVHDYVDFHHVPSGALYWLRNLTEGKEERVFTYTDNEITYW